MASEALKAFLVERLLDLDPNLSEDEGSLMFSKVIDPLIKRLGVDPLTTDVESFIVSKLDESFPNLDVSSPGSILRDVLVTPLVVLMEPLRREVNYLRLQHSIEDIDALSEEEADALLANLFVFRGDGDYARTTQRVYYSSAREVSIDGSIVFSTGDGVGFVAEDTRTYSPSDMRKSGALYYIDIPVRGLEATAAGNVAKNTIRFVDGLDGVLRTFNTTSAVGGVTAEVNSDLRDRADRALSERSLNTKRGIETALFDNFAELLSVDIIGYGEADMQRDILEGQVEVTSEETVGPITYVTSKFRSLSIFKIGPLANTFLPFTNTLVLHNVPIAKATAVANSKFLRVFDGNGYYDDLQLSRVREIDEVAAAFSAVDGAGGGVDITIRVKDFVVYPKRPSLTDQSTSVQLYTDGVLHPFNRYAREGSAHRLTVEDAGADVAIGAPLPVTDYVTTATMTGAPTSVEYGKDFLVMVAADAGSLHSNTAYHATDSESLATTFRVLPMDAWYTGGILGVARADSFMLDKDRSGFSGASTFAYSPEKAVSASTNTLKVIDCGCPAFTQPWSVVPATPDNTRFDGVTLETWSKNAGAAMYLAEGDGSAYVDITIGADAKSTYVLLEPSTSTWLERGVAVGHHIALGLCVSAFGLTKPTPGALIGSNLAWSGWGRVDYIDPADPHKLRAVGVDWYSAHLANLHGLSASAAGQLSTTLATLDYSAPDYDKTVATSGGVLATLSINVINYPGMGPGLDGVAGVVLTGTPSSGGGTLTLTGQADGTLDLSWTVGVPGSASGVGTINYATGDVVADISAAGILNPNPGPVTLAVVYQYIVQDQYRLMWTVYEGQHDIVTSDGVVKKSYTDLVLPPAYGLVGATHNVMHMAPAGYRYNNGGAVSSGYFGTLSENHGIAFNNTTNIQHGFWIRLSKSFNALHASLGKTPVEACQAAELLDNEDYDAGLDAVQALYPKDRYPVAEAADTIRTGTSHEHILNMTSLPVQQGAIAISDPTGTPTYDITPDAENPHQHGGFLIPHPFGGKWDDGTSAIAKNAYVNNLDLQNQMVHLYDSETVTTEPGGIQVSGIPGSTPFPGSFNGPISVNDNEIHIGGMTDVYVIGSAVDEATTNLITMTPEDLLGAEVVAANVDGNWVAGSSTFNSLELESAVLTEFGIGAGLNGHLGNYVVQLVNPPSSEPTFFRILNNVAGGVIIDGTFSAGPFANVGWRLLKTCTTSLPDPVVVVQQDVTLFTSAGSKTATLGPITFLEDPALVPLFLEVGSGADKGEYSITSKLASTVELDVPMLETASALPFRVYRKQDAALSLPLVRVANVSLAGDSAGIAVPYMHPVDAVASSFAGINNDPVTGTAATLTNATGGAKLVADSAAGTNFVTLGVLVNDVVRLDNQPDGLKYFYVTAFDATNNANDTLVLDREITVTAAITGVTFTVGHPSVGTAKLYFQAPTYIEIGPSTEFSYVDPLDVTRRFRPSPAEESLVYLSHQLSTDLSVSAEPTMTSTLLIADSVNYFTHGVEVGDEVSILTRDIYSSTFSLSGKSNILCANKTLMLNIDGANYPVIFGGTDPRTLDDVAADINAAVGSLVYAVVVEIVVGVSWRLELKSRSNVEVVDEGSVGILNTLNLTSSLKNNPATLVKNYQVKAVTYDTVSNKTWLEIEAGPSGDVPQLVTAGYGNEYVYIQVNRKKYQRVYPGDMVLGDTGVYSATVRLTSFDPLEEDETPVGQQLAVSGYESFGYELVVENNNYSYSQGEVVSLRTTPVVLPIAATSLETVYAVAGATVTVGYDYSSLTYEIQDYLLDPENRVVNNNPLARHFLPAYPAMAIDFRGSVATSTVTTRVEEYLKSLYPNEPLEVFDLTSVLSTLGLDYVSFPQEAAFLTHDRDRKRSMVRSNDVVALNKKFHIMGDLGLVVVNRIG